MALHCSFSDMIIARLSAGSAHLRFICCLRSTFVDSRLPPCLTRSLVSRLSLWRIWCEPSSLWKGLMGTSDWNTMPSLTGGISCTPTSLHSGLSVVTWRDCQFHATTLPDQAGRIQAEPLARLMGAQVPLEGAHGHLSPGPRPSLTGSTCAATDILNPV